jgi:predicted transposase YbfD/YdcC
MECTPAAVVPATPAALAVSPQGLLAAFAAVPDPRRQASIDYPLPALLALAVTAILANQHSPLAIAEWAARQGEALLAPLGFRDGRTPCQSTLHRVFAALCGEGLAGALGAYFARAAAPDPGARGGQGVAFDGKAQRGRLQFQVGGSPVHALTAFCHGHGVVLAQEAIDCGADKAEAELTVAPALAARVEWPGRVLTGDALFCQRALCRQVVRAGGDYLVLVRENQPTLLHDLALLFDLPPDLPAPRPLLDRRAAVTVERGHGRTRDRRHLVASTDLTGYLDWPGLAQVFRLERTWREGGARHRQVTYGITSLPPEAADAARLRALKRGHWQIENRLRRTKDVTLGEDASTIHAGAGPTVMCRLRDTALGLLHRAGCRAIASRLRALADTPATARALVLGPPPTHA